MDLKNKKEFLHKNGYCDFEIKNFKEEFYYILEKIKFKKDDIKYLEGFKRLRFDYHSTKERIQTSDEYESHEECNDKKFEFIKKYDETGIAQIWQMKDVTFPDEKYTKEIHNIFYEILNYFYGKTVNDVNMGIQWTLYSEGCFLKDHNDGQGEEYQNTCAILIYLNDEWKEEWGGNLILRNTKNVYDEDKKTIYKVIPEFGKVAIIDLEVFDTAHAVEKIIGQHNRCTILAFATSKERKEKYII